MVHFFKNDIFSVAGSPVRIIYSPQVQRDGSIVIVESGKEDFQAYIQSFVQSCDIAYIMASVANGDLGALNRVQGSYGDFTKVPKTYAEFLQLQIDAKNTFDQLPVDVKAKFDNDVNKFMVNAGEKEWFETLGIEVGNGEEIRAEEIKVESEER